MQRQITVIVVHAKEIRIKLEAMQEEDRSKPGMHSFYHKRNVLILIQKCLILRSVTYHYNVIKCFNSMFHLQLSHSCDFYLIDLLVCYIPADRI